MAVIEFETRHWHLIKRPRHDIVNMFELVLAYAATMLQFLSDKICIGHHIVELRSGHELFWKSVVSIFESLFKLVDGDGAVLSAEFFQAIFIVL